ncbi:hypothetical protein FBU59_001092 [Linderina macrospora]|uniref:Uncharacterized protein n=1 Tax=Linderina macrospora TaxID=4868 RepID=A0ACC1JF87_9FUNG|nr:hypothetical protein FBU59_001092 [Linderina macrospora]
MVLDYTSPSSPPPKGWRKYAHRFRDRPASYLTSFALLHELTAIVPLFGVYYTLEFFQMQVPFPEDVMRQGNRYINKLRQYAGMEALDEGSPVLVNLATSYAVVKAAAPLRIAASLAMTPAFARAFVVPIARVFERLRGKPRV